MINGSGTLAEISGALCKAVVFCLMWNKRTTMTKVPASLHSGTAASGHTIYHHPGRIVHVCSHECWCMCVYVYNNACISWMVPLSTLVYFMYNILLVFLCSSHNDRQCRALCTRWRDMVPSSLQLQRICSIKRLKYRRLISLWMNRHLREQLSS